MSSLPKFVLVAGYNNFKRHKGILQIFKDYCERLPYIGHTEDTWFNKQDFYIFPDYSSIERVLSYLSEHINHGNIFRYSVYGYNSTNNTYYELNPVRPQVGIIMPSRIKITPEFEKKLLLLSEN